MLLQYYIRTTHQCSEKGYSQTHYRSHLTTEILPENRIQMIVYQYITDARSIWRPRMGDQLSNEY